MATTRQAALAHLSAPDARFDAVLLDLGLPDADDMEALSALLGQKVPIVVLTSMSADEGRDKALAMGADAFISKRELDMSNAIRAIGLSAIRFRATKLFAPAAQSLDKIDSAIARLETANSNDNHLCSDCPVVKQALAGDCQSANCPTAKKDDPHG